MDCSKVLDMIYEYSGDEDSMPLLNQIQIWLHTFFCSDCTEEIERFELARNILRNDFFPHSLGFEHSIMSKIALENEETETSPYSIPAGISTRNWVIMGIVLFTSLATAFLGFEFQNIARETGMSFLLPVGITVGVVLTVYGAFFIGSHLKELTERFGL